MHASVWLMKVDIKVISVITLAFVFVLSTTLYVASTAFSQSETIMAFSDGDAVETIRSVKRELEALTEETIKIFPERRAYSTDEVIILSVENYGYNSMKVTIERLVNGTAWLKVDEETIEQPMPKIII
ncbi:MAG: hypothetical protein DRJ44_05260, partial [Thermoprotei archaeon]